MNLLQMGVSAVSKGVPSTLHDLRLRAELTAVIWVTFAVAAVFLTIAATTFLTAEVGLAPASLIMAAVFLVIALVMMFVRRVTTSRVKSSSD